MRDDLDVCYGKLAMWAVGVLNSHQLTTAMLIGMAVGAADAIMAKTKAGGELDMNECTQYECMRAIIEKRKEEIELYVHELNKLGIPLPEVDMEEANEAIEEQFNKGHKLAISYDKVAIRDTMDKLMAGITGLPEIKDE